MRTESVWCSQQQAYLQHVQQRRLARVVETQKQEFGMLVQQA